MRHAVAVLCALLTACGQSEPRPSPTADLQQLVDVAVSQDVANARSSKRKVCIDREFRPPLEQTIQEWQLTRIISPDWYAVRENAGEPMLQNVDAQLSQQLQQALMGALSGGAKVTRASAIITAPTPLVLDASGSDHESECEREMPHGLETPKPNGPEQVTLTRPVFVDGFAFIEYAKGCGGLCYGSFLEAFEKRAGKWTYVATKPLAVG